MGRACLAWASQAIQTRRGGGTREADRPRLVGCRFCYIVAMLKHYDRGSSMNADGPHRLDVAMGQRIRERRRALGMSQGDLARALGITFQQVQKYERGANRVSFSRLMQVVDALNCHLTDLTEGLDPDRPTRELDQVRRLISEDGAYELLEAYAALRNKPLQRALLQHAKALAGVDQK